MKGRITDAESGVPIASANIYLPELHQGSISLSDGTFTVSVPKGKLLIQVSHIGYQTYFTTVDIHRDTSLYVQLKPSIIRMEEVVVTGPYTQAPAQTTFNVAQLTAPEIAQMGAYNISDALSRLPGISQLTTGPGISKPVIRGLYGNRIQVNVNGLRFDNQQWQDEHGLGLSDIGVDRLEIIRGPATVLYGSDAMGGVVNVVDEKPAPVNSRVRDLHARIYSNTYGISLNYGTRSSTEKRWKRFRVGFDNHADYSDGSHKRVLNSRFASYNVKASWGRHRMNSTHVINLIASHSQFGFVFDSISPIQKDGRLSRSFSGPHHLVSFAHVNSENTYYRGSKKFKLNGGFISNLRMEDEGGGGISLSMLLNTLNVLGQITVPVGDGGEWSYGVNAMMQTNTNFGSRIIVPDALTGEFAAFSFFKQSIRRWLIEGGIRYDYRFIGTYATSNLNVIGNDSPTEDIVPFNRFYNALNVSAGVGYHIAKPLQLRINVSSGYRPGNLAELSSNGLHEGTLRWEIGLPRAKIEQNFNAEVSAIYQTSHFRASVSAYRNHFIHYFYLQGTGLEYYGFGIYHYQQSNATLRGGEADVEWNPNGTPIELQASYSMIDARKEDGSYLPFIPANKNSWELRWHLADGHEFSQSLIGIGGTYVWAQDHPAAFETSTPAYFLLNARVATQWHKFKLSLTGNNLLNRHYYDHLSRFKYYGIANMGMNIVAGISFNL